ncbi:rCG61840, partial [Rattus norvegicus]
MDYLWRGRETKTLWGPLLIFQNSSPVSGYRFYFREEIRHQQRKMNICHLPCVVECQLGTSQ